MAKVITNGYKGRFDLVIQDQAILKKYTEAKRNRLDSDNKYINTDLQERLDEKLKFVKSFLRSQYPNTLFYITSSIVDGAYIDSYTSTEEPKFFELKKSKKTWQGRYPNKFKLSDIDITSNKSIEGFWKIKDNEVVEIDSDDYDFSLHLYKDKGENKIKL